MPRMPSGKYQNADLSEVPPHYIRWFLVSRLYPVSEPLLSAMLDRCGATLEEIWAERIGGVFDPEGGGGVPADTARTRLEEVVRGWYFDLARKWHPDHGGNAEAMKAVNDAHEKLRKVLGL